MKFGQHVDLLTIEIEHVNIDALITLQSQGVKVYPKPHTLSTIQDKIEQKKAYQKNRIPTASFQSFPNKKELSNARLSFPCIWKIAKFGYDGFGVKKLNNIDDIAFLPDAPCLIEHLVPIQKEISVVVARTPEGESACYPAVEMEFHSVANQVEFVFYPSSLSKDLELQAISLAHEVAKAFDHVGLLAVELFLDHNNKLLVNEVAPRPHNSGHLSMEGANVSQFEQHLRSILNMPLSDPTFKSATIMLNLVGGLDHQGNVKYQNIEQALNTSNAQIHIYGKKQTRPMRKMGHITLVGDSLESIKKQAKQLKKNIHVIAQ